MISPPSAPASVGYINPLAADLNYHYAINKLSELVVNGYLGNIKRIEAGVPAGDKAGGNATPMEVPAELDYEMWVGPAPMKP